MRVFRVLLYCFLPLVLFSQAEDQGGQDPVPRVMIEGSLGWGEPRGNFDRKFDGNALHYRLRLNYGIIPDQYLYAFAGMNWDRYQRFEVVAFRSLDGIVYEVSEEVSLHSTDYLIGAKYELPQWKYLIPVVEFAAGARNSYLRNVFTLEVDNEEIDNFRTVSDWNYVTTLGGGVQIPLLPKMHFHLMVNYSQTGSFDVMLPVSNPEDFDPMGEAYNYFELRSSPMNVLHWRFGLNLYF